MGNRHSPSDSGGGTGDSYGDESRKPEEDTEQQSLPDAEDQDETEEDETQSTSSTKRPKSLPNSAGSGGGGGGAKVPESTEPGEEDEKSSEEETAEVPSEEGSEQAPAAGDPPESNETEADESRPDENEHPDSDEESESEQHDSPDVTIVEFTNAWAAESWCNEPEKLKLRERYRHQLDFVLRPSDPIKFADPRTEAGRWVAVQDGDNPVNQEVWFNEPPADTLQSTRAIQAAIHQGAGFDYIRRLWIQTIVAGENVEDDETLIKAAQAVELDIERFMKDFDEGDPDDPEAASDENTSPDYVTFADFLPVYSESEAEFGELEEIIALLGGELAPLPARPVPKLLESYGPLTTEEIRTVHGWSREKAINRLAKLEDSGEIEQLELPSATMWAL